MKAATSEQCTIVYDDTCRFCRRQMDSIRGRDRDGIFEFLPNRDPALLKRFPQLAGDDLNNGLRLVLPDQRVFVGADAVHQIARRLPSTRWFAWLYRVPVVHTLARWTYGYIAARRYRLAGRCDPGEQACRVDDA